MKARMTLLAISLLVLFLLALAPALGVTNFDSVTLAGNLIVNGDSRFDNTVRYAPNNQTFTGTQTLTPTATLYTLAPPAVLTLTLSVGSAEAGDLLLLTSTVTTNTLVQTANTTLSSAQTITQNDVLKFVFANNKWVLVNSRDNPAD